MDESLDYRYEKTDNKHTARVDADGSSRFILAELRASQFWALRAPRAHCGFAEWDQIRESPTEVIKRGIFCSS